MKPDGVILVGGQGRRMGGCDKGSLLYENRTFLERMIEELWKLTGQLWISGGERKEQNIGACQWISDEISGCGPMGGLYTVLGRCQSDLLLVAACDMPFLKAELYQYLLEQLEIEKKAYIGAVPVVEGKIHPLAAVYRKEWQNTLKTQLAIGNYRLLDALEKETVLYVDVTKKEGFSKMLSNINTLKEYENL